MKGNYIFIIVFIQFSYLGCRNNYPDTSDLRKLTRAEIIEFEKEGREIFNEEAIWYNKRKPTPEEMQQFRAGELYCDVLVNKDNDIEILRLRSATYHDNITEILRRNVDFSPSYNNIYLDLNCDSLTSQIEELNLYSEKSKLVKRQIKDSLLLDHFELDEFDFGRVILSSIEKECGFKDLDKKGIRIIWSLAHHNGKETLGYYFTYIEKQTETGNLRPEHLALATDRLLMYYEYEQVYGSQISNSELYPIRNVDSVNIRRAEIGLHSMDEYLNLFSVDTTSELYQKVMTLDKVDVK